MRVVRTFFFETPRFLIMKQSGLELFKEINALKAFSLDEKDWRTLHPLLVLVENTKNIDVANPGNWRRFLHNQLGPLLKELDISQKQSLLWEFFATLLNVEIRYHNLVPIPEIKHYIQLLEQQQSLIKKLTRSPLVSYELKQKLLDLPISTDIESVKGLMGKKPGPQHAHVLSVLVPFERRFHAFVTKKSKFVIDELNDTKNPFEASSRDALYWVSGRRLIVNALALIGIPCSERRFREISSKRSNKNKPLTNRSRLKVIQKK